MSPYVRCFSAYKNIEALLKGNKQQPKEVDRAHDKSQKVEWHICFARKTEKTFWILFESKPYNRHALQVFA